MCWPVYWSFGGESFSDAASPSLSGGMSSKVKRQRSLSSASGAEAERQRKRNEKLEAQIKDLKEELLGGLKGLNKLEGWLDRLEG